MVAPTVVLDRFLFRWGMLSPQPTAADGRHIRADHRRSADSYQRLCPVAALAVSANRSRLRNATKQLVAERSIGKFRNDICTL
jgi:hypothetical protein